MKSQHFAIGTKVMYAGQTFKIEEYPGNRNVIVTDEDGGTYVIHNPYFMR